MQQALTFNEFDWRSAAVTMSAGRVISTVSQHSTAAVRNYQVFTGLGTVNEALKELMHFLHTPEAVTALESAQAETLKNITDKMHEVHGKIRILSAQIKRAETGKYWHKLFAGRLSKIESYNQEICAHVEAFRSEAALIILGPRDQEFVIESLMAQAEPSDALRRAFTRH